MQLTAAEAPAKNNPSLFRPHYTELEKGTYLPTKLSEKP
jgi:hypothetical protein